MDILKRSVGIISLLTVFVSTQVYTGDSIAWQEWNKEAFDQAKKEKKMIIVNVGIEVCYACNWMEEGTYSQQPVIDRIDKNFVAIQVDANARPDLGERYSDWAWPATIFLDPNGTQVLALRGSRRPRNFIPVLDKLISQHAKGELKADVLAPYSAPEKPETSALTFIRDGIRKSLDEDYDDVNAGWGDELKEINGFGRIEQLFFRAFTEADSISRKRAVKTAYAMAERMDHVWGGFYSAGEEGWKVPITEKRTGAQATALMAFAAAYQITKDKKFITAADEVDKYLRDWMMTKQGSFYTSQEGESEELPKDMSPAEYFELKTDAERRKFGVPVIDHTVYTDLNARVIKGYVEMYEASGEERYLNRATKAANTIVNTRLQAEGWLLQVVQTEKVKNEARIHLLNAKPRPILRAQAEFGIALLGLHRATGNKKWIEIAVKLAKATKQHLEDPKLGGFYATTVEDTNGIAARRKPLQDNGVAARFYYQLGRYIKNEEYEKAAERALRAVVSDEILEREGRIVGNYAVALETVTANYVEFSVVGEANDPLAVKLFDTARNYHDPRKILHYVKPGHYPDLGRAAMYICNPTACSVPIFNTEGVQEQADKFMPKG